MNTSNVSRRDIAITRLNSVIEKGRTNAGKVIEQVFKTQPVDRLPKGKTLTFSANGDLKVIQPDRMTGQPITETLHRHALGQVAATTDMPVRFIDNLYASPWGRELIAHNLNQVFANRFPQKNFLTRSVQGQVRGFLSDSYKRIDSRPLIECFTEGMRSIGALPYEGYSSDTKIAVQAILPELFEPVPGEIVAYGVSWSNSDFGNGANEISDFILRLVCTNGAIGTDVLRQIHLGRRLDPDMVYSQRTYELDAKTAVSATKDVLGRLFDRPTIEARMSAIRDASDTKLTVPEVKSTLKRMMLGKAEADLVTEAFNSADIEMMPAGMTNWRLSNALSWVAGNKIEDTERKLQFQRMAGELVKRPA